MSGHTDGSGASQGTWKLAYGDFITTLMCLFLVLWISGESADVRKSIEQSFTEDMTHAVRHSVGSTPARPLVPGQSKSGEHRAVGSPGQVRPSDLKVSSLGALQARYENRSFRVRNRPNGLVFTLDDTAQDPVFHAGSSEVTEYGILVLNALGWELARHPDARVDILCRLAGGEAGPGGDASLTLATERAGAVGAVLRQGGLPAVALERMTGGRASDRNTTNSPAVEIVVTTPESEQGRP